MTIARYFLSGWDLPLRSMTCLFLLTTPCYASELSLPQAQQVAIQLDPWQQLSRLQEQALLADSHAAGTLSDPVLSLGLANLPMDGWQFNQEAMTQLKVGLSQQFSRGDSLDIRQQQLRNLAAKHPQLRKERELKLKVIVANLWLDAFTAEQKLQIVSSSRSLFAQLSDLVGASYGVGQGRTRQQDVIQAQVELTRLDDRYQALVTARDTRLANLSEWLQPISSSDHAAGIVSAQVQLSAQWPVIALPNDALQMLLQQQDRMQLAQLLAKHPAMLAAQQQIKAQTSGIALARQKYQPQWGLNASYAYRDSDPAGNSRADFFSVGLSVDLPLFTHDRQDKELESATLQAEAAKTEQQLLLRNLLAQAISSWQAVVLTRERLEHYQSHILPQMAAQAEAALNAYTTDDGDFSEVMRARIAQLNGELDIVELQSELARQQSQLLYFFPLSDYQSAQSGAGVQP